MDTQPVPPGVIIHHRVDTQPMSCGVIIHPDLIAEYGAGEVVSAIEMPLAKDGGE